MKPTLRIHVAKLVSMTYLLINNTTSLLIPLIDHEVQLLFYSQRLLACLDSSLHAAIVAKNSKEWPIQF